MPTTFPPTLERKQWKGSFAVERTARNPVNHTRRPRELSAETAAEVRAAAGPHSSLLFEAANLRAPPKSKASSSPPIAAASAAPADGAPPVNIYQHTFPGTVPPEFSVFAFCKKYGRAPRAADVPAPRIDSVAAWMAEYGKPTKPDYPPATFTEFAETTAFRNGEPQNTRQMFRGSVLR